LKFLTWAEIDDFLYKILCAPLSNNRDHHLVGLFLKYEATKNKKLATLEKICHLIVHLSYFFRLSCFMKLTLNRALESEISSKIKKKSHSPFGYLINLKNLVDSCKAGEKRAPMFEYSNEEKTELVLNGERISTQSISTAIREIEIDIIKKISYLLKGSLPFDKCWSSFIINKSFSMNFLDCLNLIPNFNYGNLL
jgi:hypothetical protein